jgi:hypothetical protein
VTPSADLRDLVSGGNTDEARFGVHRQIHVILCRIASMTAGTRNSLLEVNIMPEERGRLIPHLPVANKALVEPLLPL